MLSFIIRYIRNSTICKIKFLSVERKTKMFEVVLIRRLYLVNAIYVEVIHTMKKKKFQIGYTAKKVIRHLVKTFVTDVG